MDINSDDISQKEPASKDGEKNINNYNLDEGDTPNQNDNDASKDLDRKSELKDENNNDEIHFEREIKDKDESEIDDKDEDQDDDNVEDDNNDDNGDNCEDDNKDNDDDNSEDNVEDNFLENEGKNQDEDNITTKNAEHQSSRKTKEDDKLSHTEQTPDKKYDGEDENECGESDSDVENLISHIFGDSEEDEEFEGFDTNNVTLTKLERKEQTLSSSDEEKIIEESSVHDDGIDNEVYESKPERPEVYDFDLMMQRKKQEGSKSRRKRGYDLISDSDDLIAEIISQMHTSAEEDRLTNRKRLPARKKIKLLPVVVSQVKKADLKVAFLDQGILSAMAEWLTPLPDKSLPYLKIRESILKLLEEFHHIEPSLLKSSRIGKVVMYLYKHPKETKENKKIARRLIMEWSRPIFNVKTDFNSMSREERERRDLERMPKRMRMNRKPEFPDEEQLPSGERTPAELDLGENKNDLRPGDQGWIPRAIVPKPSNKDYLVRPKWKIETDSTVVPPKKKDNRIEKHMRHFESLKKKQRGVGKGAKLSIMGN